MVRLATGASITVKKRVVGIFPLNIEFLNILPGSFWFSIKVCFFGILFVVARAILPRYRFDQLMRLGWKVFYLLL